MSRALLVTAVAVLLSIAGSGCAGRDGPARGAGLSADETRWAAGWAAWSDELDAALADESAARFAVADDPASYAVAAGRLRRCAARLQTRVGPAPTGRLDVLQRRLRGTCRLLARATTRVARAYARDDDPVGAIVAVSDALGKADAARADVEERLASFSLARRRLPVARSPDPRSHADPTLTAAAERTIEGFETEVRCWSDAEWPAMIEEETALSNGGITVDSTGAFANTTTLEVNMRSGDCDALGRAEREGAWWPDDGHDRRALAWALGVLAHEAQHIAGAQDEAETECRAQQRLADVATALGAPVARARGLAELSWGELYGTLPDDYRTALCRDGGPYDLRPGVSGRWPWG